MSEHEALRKALHWLTEQPRIDAAAIAEASRHFDLSPLDEQFLRDYFLRQLRQAPSKKPQSDDLKSN
ncbi:hypothetical protein PU634_06325 [Oceanimonas pelagia]|uniref:Uncharacterized protein n=1 Tax=Oceanimonas pelagia TaxID=3028314 RepID=A0AA50QD65_9GAMM|nr:hypothetical protein [Oceanimonas pelagia]WMC11977.1 hypothetical protein PU634_06325 [Oceanimonas pelagia]